MTPTTTYNDDANNDVHDEDHLCTHDGNDLPALREGGEGYMWKGQQGWWINGMVGRDSSGILR